MTDTYTKTIDVGTVPGQPYRNVQVLVRLERNDDGLVLSIQGEVRSKRSGRCHEAGQCIDAVESVGTPLAKDIVAVWRRWHLNSMRAGCEHQRAEEWDKRPIDPAKPLDAYGIHHPNQQYPSWNMLTWVRPTEVPGGLLAVPCEQCGYQYGTRWLYEPLPDEIVAKVKTW